MNEEENVVIIPHEDHVLNIPYEERAINIAAEIRELEIGDMLQATKPHDAGNTIRWRVDYKYWLDNAADIQTMNITSSSATLSIGTIQILGKHLYFFLIGGTVGEQATITLTMVDNLGNRKIDTLQITVIQP